MKPYEGCREVGIIFIPSQYLEEISAIEEFSVTDVEKKFKMKKRLPKVSKEELNKKSTKELLGYLSKLHKYEESFSASDMDIDLDLNDNEIIYFKQTEKWRTAYQKVKSILDKRENINQLKK